MIRFSRREFLRASLLAAPFVSLLSRARAAGPRVADRLVVFYTPNGTVHRFWRPMGAGDTFQFPPGSILSPLAPYARDLIVCDGIDFAGVTDHEKGLMAMLTAGGTAKSVGGGASVDQFVASRIGAGSRFSSVELGIQTSVKGATNETRMCYAAPGVHVEPEDDPASAWARLFGVAGGAGAAKLLARRKSVIDLASGELRDLRDQVGTEERRKLDQHLDALRATEQAIDRAAKMNDPACAPTDRPAMRDPEANEGFRANGRAQMDILVAALACGLTRVASLQWSYATGQPVMRWAPANADEGHHSLSHKVDADPDGVAAFVRAERWYAEQFTYLLDRMKRTPDPVRGGSLLDSSAILWIKEIGDGRLHTCTSVPIILAGGANGFFRPGQYLQLDHAPHQQLHVTLCRAMGIDVDRFGDETKGMGALPGLGV